MMTDDDMFSIMYLHCCHPKQDATNFKGSAKEVAAYTMGVAASDASADFDIKHPWSRQLQIGRIMQTLYDAPGPVAISIALATLDKATLTPYQRANLIKGYGFVMSDYAFRIFEASASSGIEDLTTRTYHVVKHILNLGILLQILESPNQSVNLESVQYSLGNANTALISACNESVDAHPMARTMLRRFIDEVQRHITPGVKDAA